MRRLIVIAVILVAALALYFFMFKNDAESTAEKQGPLKVSRHSAAFNNSFDSVMNSYFDLKNALVDADTVKAKIAVTNFVQRVDSFSLEELKKDSNAIFESAHMQLGDVKANATSLLLQKDITEMRKDFSMIGESMYPLLKLIHYEGKILYWQNCPMAFGDDKGANWISNTKEIVNPYLGKNHPEFKGTMLHCGEVKDSIFAQ